MMEMINFYLYHPSVFWMIVIVILLVSISLFCVRRKNMKRTCVDDKCNDKFGKQSNIRSDGFINSWMQKRITRDIYEYAYKQYSNVNGAKKGVITAIKKEDATLFYLYVRVEDGGIIKQTINVPCLKFNFLPKNIQDKLLESKDEVLIRELP